MVNTRSSQARRNVAEPNNRNPMRNNNRSSLEEDPLNEEASHRENPDQERITMT